MAADGDQRGGLTPPALSSTGTWTDKRTGRFQDVLGTCIITLGRGHDMRAALCAGAAQWRRW